MTLSSDLSNNSESLSKYNDLDNIISALNIYKDNFEPIDLNKSNVTLSAHNIWKQSLDRRNWYYSTMTILNSYTNHLIGTYSGITDYQSAQFLFAGCAPNNPLKTGTNYPVTSVYDYLSNARLNNMPLPTFGIIELFLIYFLKNFNCFLSCNFFAEIFKYFFGILLFKSIL